ncbi:MAG: hypothetical protein ACYCXF_02115 [Thermoleophilia bacterium]
MIKRPNGREIDPEKVKYQLDMLVTAIWKNAEEQLRASKKVEKEPAEQPSHTKSTAHPQTVAP